MGSKKSWRLIMIDINSSMSIKTDAGTIKGYMVCRAPKGETSPYYFPKGNMEAIYAYCGLPTANWPDLYEAEAFNQEFDIYLSCPAGSSSTYPSYFGGVYITTDGIKEFYNITSTDTVDFTEKSEISNVEVSYMSAYDAEKPNEANLRFYNTYDAALKGTKNTIALTFEFPQDDWKNLQEIGINYWGDKRTTHDAGMYYYTIDKTSHKLYCEDENGDPITTSYAGIWYLDNYSYHVVIGGSDWYLADNETLESKLKKYNIDKTSTNQPSARKIPFLTLDGLYNYSGESSETISIEALLATGNSLVKNSTQNWTWSDFTTNQKDNSSNEPKNAEYEFTYDDGGNKVISGTLTKEFNLGSALTGLTNIKDITLAYVNQKSATEKTTKLTISNIGYDKWRYDMGVSLVEVSDVNKLTLEAITDIQLNNDAGLIAVTTMSSGVINNAKKAALQIKLYKFDTSNIDGTWVSNELNTFDVTEDYQTQSILITKCYQFNDSNLKNVSEHALKNKILYVYDNKNMFIEYDTELEENAGWEYGLTKDINFNTITLSCSEEVYPGEMMSGGEFTGSLSETGKDTYGANIYWPNVLSPDDFSFIEVHPVHTLEEISGALDPNDFIYEKARIVDSKLMFDKLDTSIPSTVTRNLKGQRYVTSLVNKNVKAGTVGGSWVDGFTSVIKQGWNEAFDDEYDDVFIFMDPVGEEFIHTMQASLAQTHQLAIYLSPKIVTQQTFVNPNKMTVTGRSKLCAQYAGEFKYYDSYTGKSFYMKPIGDVGLMCGRIFENKLGGWAPAWYNYQGMGGQLPRAILSSKYNFSDAATKILDTKGINAIIYNTDDGLMAVSSKTTQDPSEGGDWEELGHVMSFVLCKREIRDNVMRPQIKKPIDDFWINKRQQQVDAILEKRTTGSNKIWNSAVCDIAGQNNATTRAARNFVIYVRVKVNVFSETVTLKFENVDQATVLS